MKDRHGGRRVVLACCIAIFWPGAFIFAFPGVMASQWQQAFGVSRAATGQTLFFVLAAVGVFMFITGRWQEKVGPSILAALGAVLCGASTIMVGHAGGMAWVYLWAFLMGISSSLIYIPTLTVVQRWFPARKGLVSGLVNLAFGFSAAVMSPVFSRMLASMSYEGMTLLLGLLASGFGLAASCFVRFPESEKSDKLSVLRQALASQNSFSARQSLRTRTFWLIWGSWAMAGAGGIAMVTLSTSYGLFKGLTLSEAVVILTAFNLTNGASRLLSGYLSDRTGRNRVMGASFLCGACAYWLMPHLEGLVLWAVLASVVGFAFGTLFAVSAPLVVDCFGLDHFGKIFGLIFTAYGFVAGALGPWLSGYVLDLSGGRFAWVFLYLGGFYLLSAILICFATPPKARACGGS
ncbi:MAG: MFS transporter [Desulfobacterota bacterium]|jgi:OFA family oxalate/formate antiporter-like MFS transporter|nr:MFS transporter [Thermodesulfobacteriota bacterium]